MDMALVGDVQSFGIGRMRYEVTWLFSSPLHLDVGPGYGDVFLVVPQHKAGDFRVSDVYLVVEDAMKTLSLMSILLYSMLHISYTPRWRSLLPAGSASPSLPR